MSQMIDDRTFFMAEEGDHHHTDIRCPNCGFPQTLCLKKNKMIFPEVRQLRKKAHYCFACGKKFPLEDRLLPEALEEYRRFNP